MLYCKQCGNLVSEIDRFCEKCAARLDVEGSVLSALEYSFEKNEGAFNPTNLDWAPRILGYEILGKRITDFAYKIFEEEYYIGKSYDDSVSTEVLIKFMSFPSDDYYNKVLLDFSYDKVRTKTFFDSIVSKYKKQIEENQAFLMENDILSIIEDFDFAFSSSTNKHYMFFQLKKAKPLLEYIKDTNLNVRQCTNLIINICKEVSQYHKFGKGLGHLSENNVFIAENGTPILGFPQIENLFTENNPYKSYLNKFLPSDRITQGSTILNSDVYSLGMIMYRLLNAYRDPFLNLYIDSGYAEIETAQNAINQMQIPQIPFYAQNSIGSAAVKAVSPLELRFRTVDEFLRILENSLNYLSADELDKTAVDFEKISSGENLFEGVARVPVATVSKVPPAQPKTDENALKVNRKEAAENKQKSPRLLIIIFAIVCLVLLIVVAILFIEQKNADNTFKVIENQSARIISNIISEGRFFSAN